MSRLKVLYSDDFFRVGDFIEVISYPESGKSERRFVLKWNKVSDRYEAVLSKSISSNKFICFFQKLWYKFLIKIGYYGVSSVAKN